jgi:hypothetical protein
VSYYQSHIEKDYQSFACDPSASDHPLFPLLSEEYQQVVSRFSRFKLGIFLFGIFRQLECRELGPYIVIANGYYGNGSYATWNYYLDGDYYGKRIDDAPCKKNLGRQTNYFRCFDDLLTTFYNSIGRYDVHKGAIRSLVHGLSFS